jgi:uncharacterized protein (DUF302 family)
MLKSSSLVTSSSSLPVEQIVEKFKTIFNAKGITLFAHIDHSEAARKVNLNLQKEQVLIFGDPKTGTALMQENPEIGIELPLKILIWQAPDGLTYIGYKDPIALAELYGIKKNIDILKKMSEGLHQLVNKVTGG